VNRLTAPSFIKPNLQIACLICFLAVVAVLADGPFVARLARKDPVAGRFFGAILMSELGCAPCHGSGRAEFASKPGPDLSAIGARVDGAHLPRFIASPVAVKPGTTMPDVLGHLPKAERGEAANALFARGSARAANALASHAAIAQEHIRRVPP
jgi:hypothetical protein